MEHRSLDRVNEVIKIIKDSNIIKDMSPKKLCNTIEALGPTYIKLGQILSTRVDILPSEYCDELSRLRSNVEAMNYDLVLEILNRNFDNLDGIFLSIEEKPIGSASIAQVHKAILRKNNEEVVIKIKRPNIEEVFKDDFTILKRVVDILHLNKIVKVINLDDVLDEVYAVCLEEVNFIVEANNLLEFKNNNLDNIKIDCPNIYKEYSTNDIIVMEYINGYGINDINSLRENGYNLEFISNVLSENYIKQALDDGVFHADPHSDNIIVSNNKIYYIDLGMVGRLSDRNKQLLRKCIQAIILKDYKEVSRILINMCNTKEEVDYIKLENEVSDILENYASLDLESISISSFIKKMFSMLRDNHLVLDKDITLLIRGIGIIEGVLLKLDPNTSLLKVLALNEEKSFKKSLLDSSNLNKVGRKIIKSTSDIIGLPNEVSSLLKSLNNGEIKFKVELSDSDKHIDKIENLVHEVILAFIDGCLIISTVLVEGEIKFILLILLLIITSWLIVKMLFDYLRKGY